MGEDFLNTTTNIMPNINTSEYFDKRERNLSPGGVNTSMDNYKP